VLVAVVAVEKTLAVRLVLAVETAGLEMVELEVPQL
jgi:hypothetical protein